MSTASNPDWYPPTHTHEPSSWFATMASWMLPLVTQDVALHASAGPPFLSYNVMELATDVVLTVVSRIAKKLASEAYPSKA